MVFGNILKALAGKRDAPAEAAPAAEPAADPVTADPPAPSADPVTADPPAPSADPIAADPPAPSADPVAAEPVAEKVEAQAVEEAKVSEPVVEEQAPLAPQPVQCEIEKAIFDSNAGFADWTEEADWESSELAPAEVENEDGWTTKTSKAKVPKKGKGRGKRRTNDSGDNAKIAVMQTVVAGDEASRAETIAHLNPMQALMASMDEELGVEVSQTDDESDDESESSVEEKAVPAERVAEKDEETKKPLSKKEQKEQKQKELEDLDDLLAEFGIATNGATAEDTANTASKSSKKKKKKKAAAGSAEAGAAPVASAEPTGPAIDIEAAKKVLKKKVAGGGGKKTSAAQAAAKALAASSKKKAKPDASKFDR